LLHVAQIGFSNDRLGRAPRQLLEAWPSLTDIAQAATRAPARVSVIQAAAVSDRFVLGGVEYHFIARAARSTAIARAPAFAELVRQLQPDVMHVHGFGFPDQVAELARLAPRTPVLIQDHADRPPRLWHWPAWRRGLRAAAGVAFCAREQAAPFVQARLIPASLPVFEVPESTARFAPGDRDSARRETGLDGDPSVLWVGHLDANKDPLTLLAGVRRALPRLPGLQLWCCFATSGLLGEVTSRLEADPRLRAHVHLLGRVPHSRVELLMRAADLYVSASHHEGSGYALIEALACGLTPVVTDIPSFRALTGRGAIGQLWPVADADALARALADASATLGPSARARARAHFEQELSFEAVGRRLGDAYRGVVAARGAGTSQ
jgi:glycosyltransferase involved in cell wall biosynthesis